MKSFKSLGAGLAALLCLFTMRAGAQQSRISTPIDNSRRTALIGHLHPKALPENDQGRVSPSLELPYVTMALAPSASQKADLDQFLAELQTPGSPNFHRWLTPEQYAARFGVSDDDLNQLTAWLQGQGLTVVSVAGGRNWIAVSGAAAQIEAAFGTEIHQYAADGETHYANAAEPSVPAALGGIVRAIRGLNDFRLKASARARPALSPDYTSASGAHNVAPNDLATIYNIAPLYAAGTNGSGQSIVIAGQTQITLSDIQQFRTNYGLPASVPQVILVPRSRDPGLSATDLAEADLDIEWSGAVARNASIIYVYAPDVMTAVQYAIDQNLAPVIATSYGGCEQETSTAEVATFRAWAQQGNAEGITWFAASGDAGGADCDDSQNSGLAVDVPASIPELTGVGGTEFQEGTGHFWNSANAAGDGSVLSYIPETAWNDSARDGSPSASGGGESILFTKPSWQTGPGVPADNARNVPDVALSASPEHDGYLVYTSGSVQVYGGTSFGSPIFAGIATLLNEYLVSTGQQPAAGLGNINPNLYSFAQTTPSAFHDITTGNNIVTVTCPTRSRTCSTAAVGYSAGPGYDMVTGLGTIDADTFITKWTSAGSGSPAPTAGATISLLSNLTTLSDADTVFLIATATGAGGITPAGVVQFSVGGSPLGSAALVGSAGTATATLAVTGSQLPLGSGTITAAYSANSATVTATVSLSVRATGSSSIGLPAIAGVANGASFKSTFAPGSILSLFGSTFSPSTTAAASVPLPISMAGVAVTVNGVAAPLYYVSAGQLNIQIPYETPVNAAVTVKINNNGQVGSKTITLAAAAPGIFTGPNLAVAPNGNAARGQIASLYITGAGVTNPAIATVPHHRPQCRSTICPRQHKP